MTPRLASEAIHLIAQLIELEDEPSRSNVAADIQEVIQLLDGSNTFGAQVAAFDTIKKLKRKIFNTPGQSRLLAKIDKLKALQKATKPLAKAIRRGVPFEEMAGNEDWVSIIFNTREFLNGGSKKLQELKKLKKSYELVALMSEMDEFYDTDEDADEEDREILVDAVSDFYDASDERIEEFKKKIERQKAEAKKGGRLKREETKEELHD